VAAGCHSAVGTSPSLPNSFSTDPIRKLSLLLGLRDNPAGLSSLERLLLCGEAGGSRDDVSTRQQNRRCHRRKLIAELARDWSRPEGGQLLNVMVREVLPDVGFM